jgi:hypothetical protein
MRYVTFYSTFLGGVSDITVHKDKATAVQFYREEAPSYFNGLLRLPKTTEPPTSCGFPHRYFSVMSLRMFKKEYPEAANAL